eukprot:SAG31_NODE_173_length_21354_cov_16.826112_19_plen_126_part_00
MRCILHASFRRPLYQNVILIRYYHPVTETSIDCFVASFYAYLVPNLVCLTRKAVATGPTRFDKYSCTLSCTRTIYEDAVLRTVLRELPADYRTTLTYSRTMQRLVAHVLIRSSKERFASMEYYFP